MTVHAGLGPGLPESVYEIALARQFERRNIPYDRQVPVEVSLDGERLGKHVFPDPVCYANIPVEIKGGPVLTRLDVRQTLRYMDWLPSDVGLLFAFGGPSLVWRRLVRSPAAAQFPESRE